jgi:RND family efflux transporter MFP subunit
MKSIAVKRRFILAAAMFVALSIAPSLRGEAREHNSNRHRPTPAFFVPVRKVQAAEQASTGEGKVLFYQDPMHPWYKSDKPGVAPDCGMKLVPIYAPEATDQPKSGERRILYYQDAMNPSHHSDKPGLAPDGMKLVPVYASETPLPPGGVEISSARQQMMGVATAKAEYRALDQTIRAVGQVAMDETRIIHVHVRTSGWIQKTFVDYTWQQVKQGDPLFTFYSPDLLATEQEYLLALKARNSLAKSSFPEIAAAGASLLEAARRRLELWDLSEAQIHDIEISGKPAHDITVYAPATGYVVDRKAFPNQYVSPEMDIYQLVDLSSVWAEGEIYESDLPLVSLGQQAVVTTDALPNAALRGRLTFISPTVKPDTRTITVRVEFPNPGMKLKPGMFAKMDLHRGLGHRLTVPVDAVLDSGAHQRVFVARGKGIFEPRTVTVGSRTGDYAVILSGLRAGEQVVTRANFLIDSESNLRESVEGMQPAEPSSPATPRAKEKGTMPGMVHQH